MDWHGNKDWFHGKRVTVMGLGRFGGGIAAARFLARHGARVTVTDLLSEADLVDSLSQLDDVSISATRFGGHDEADFHDTDLVVASPAVPREHPLLDVARRAGRPVTSEICLFCSLNRGRLIGVTGSNGKSTTSRLLHNMLQVAGFRTWLGGNIGRSLLEDLDSIQPDDFVVLELSSFQLFDLNELQLSPSVAVVTNISPNHLDWHTSFENYRRAKQTIVRWQRADDIAVLNANDSDIREWQCAASARFFQTADTGEDGVVAGENALVFRDGDSEDSVRFNPPRVLPGRHNLQNIAAAACAAWSLGVEAGDILRAINAFVPLPHRLQAIASVSDVTYVNDSLATTPESTIAALESFRAPIVLIAGGYDKGVCLERLAERIAHSVRAAILIGQTAETLDRLIASHPSGRNLARYRCESFEDAFRRAVDVATGGDIVLLSPACASYDWFYSFEDRGEQFVRLVESHRDSPRA